MRFWGILFIGLALGCTSHDAAMAPLVSDFLPLKTGASWIYAVDSVVTDQSVATTYSYQLRVTVIDSFPSGDGVLTWVLQRSKRKNDSSVWSPMSTWSTRVSNYQLVVMEENIAYIKIAAPLQNGSYWDGNGLNDLGGAEKCPGSTSSTCDIYMISNFNQPYVVPGMTFDHSLTVVESDEGDPIVSRDDRSEVYAMKIGLVYRGITQLTYCQDSLCYGKQVVNQGVTYQQLLTSYEAL